MRLPPFNNDILLLETRKWIEVKSHTVNSVNSGEVTCTMSTPTNTATTLTLMHVTANTTEIEIKLAVGELEDYIFT